MSGIANNHALLVDHESIKCHSLRNRGMQLHRFECLPVALAHRLLAGENEFVRIQENLCIIGVVTEKPFKISSVVSVNLRLDDFGRCPFGRR